MTEGLGTTEQVAEYVESLMPDARTEVFPAGDDVWPTSRAEIQRDAQPKLEHELKGVPDRWRLHAVVDSRS